MRKLVPLLIAAVAATAPLQAAPRDPEAELARTLKGRVAGEPLSCITLSTVHKTQIIDDTAILYNDGRTIFVNRPRGGAELLDRSDTLVTRTHSSKLCSVDVVQLYSAGSRIPSGSVSLGEFVPYRKPR